MKRCSWCEGSDLMRHYHDTEWGVPVHDDRLHFEYIVLDAFQAGLSWSTILNKRENFRKAFDNFEPAVVATYGEDHVTGLMENSGIIRNNLKIKATITNARTFLELQARHGSFDKFIWQFTNGRTLVNDRYVDGAIPASSPESDAMSKALQKAGFKFVGSTICYAYMQAAGMVNDHLNDCFRKAELS